jgi:hypothetical protein
MCVFNEKSLGPPLKRQNNTKYANKEKKSQYNRSPVQSCKNQNQNRAKNGPLRPRAQKVLYWETDWTPNFFRFPTPTVTTVYPC